MYIDGQLLINFYLIFLFEKIRHHLPQEWNNRVLCSFNEQLLYLKYKKGDFLEKHEDSQKTEDDEKSFFTVQIYLNSNYTGETNFFSHYTKHYQNTQIKIKPIVGRVVIFEQTGLLQCKRRINS